MSTIEEIYYTTVYPKYDTIFTGEQYKQNVKESIEIERMLRSLLPDNKVLFDRAEVVENEINEYISKNMFIIGFRMGAQVMLEILKSDDE